MPSVSDERMRAGVRMNGCGRGWRSWRGRSRASVSAIACVAAAKGRRSEPQETPSDLPRGGANDSAEEAQALYASRATVAELDGGESGVGIGFCARAVACGRAIRVLSVVDAYTRECLALEVDTSFASRRVTRVLEAIVAERGQPQAIRCDNGPELTSRHFLAWCLER